MTTALQTTFTSATCQWFDGRISSPASPELLLPTDKSSARRPCQHCPEPGLLQLQPPAAGSCTGQSHSSIHLLFNQCSDYTHIAKSSPDKALNV